MPTIWSAEVTLVVSLLTLSGGLLLNRRFLAGARQARGYDDIVIFPSIAVIVLSILMVAGSFSELSDQPQQIVKSIIVAMLLAPVAYGIIIWGWRVFVFYFRKDVRR